MSPAAKVVGLLIESDKEKVKDFLRRSGVTATGNYYLEPPGTVDRVTGKPVRQHIVRDSKTCSWLGVIEGGQYTFDFKPDHWVITQSLTNADAVASYGKFFKTREGAAAHLWHRWSKTQIP